MTELQPGLLALPGPGALHLWLLPLPVCGAEQALMPCLADDERQRAAGRRLALARRQFVVGRAALRTLLSAYAQCQDADPLQWCFAYGPHGRPELIAAQQGGMPRFNLSHAGGYILLGFAREAAPGVDIECSTRARDLLAIAQRYFDVSEYRALHACSAAERQRLFTRLWTLKEASSKARGGGLAAALRTHVFTPPVSAQGDWQAHLPGPGYWRWWQARHAGGACELAAVLYHDRPLPALNCQVRELRCQDSAITIVD